MKVNWIPVSEREPEESHKVYWTFDGEDVEGVYFRSGGEWGRGYKDGVTHWAELEFPDPPEQNVIETRAKITKANCDGYSHEVVFVAEVPRSFMGKTLKVRIEKA